MRQADVADVAQSVSDLVASGSFITNEGERPQIAFDGDAGNQNPMFARREFGVGDFYFASNATLNVLRSLNDPREFAFYRSATTGDFEGTIRGIDQGTIDDEPFTAPDTDYSLSSSKAYAVDNAVMLMSEWEVWFLRAEAAARFGVGDAASAFANAISTNFSYWDLADDAQNYIDNQAFDQITNLGDQLDAIGIQKWISMNGTQEDEGWAEMRRFDRPDHRIFTGAGGILQVPPLSVYGDRTFPASWLYPQRERSLNQNAPLQRKITDKVFWDN